MVGKGIVSPKQSTVQEIQKFPVPTTKRQILFLEKGFYRKCIPNFSEMASSLSDLTTKKGSSSVAWLSEQ